MNAEDRYFELFKGKKPDNDVELYDILLNYIQAHTQELNLNTKVKLFFRKREFTSQTDERGKKTIKTTIYDPKTGEIVNNGLDNGAYYNPEDDTVYVAYDLIENHDMFVQNMVYFTHHLIHELQHAVQYKIAEKETSYRSFLISRDFQILKYVDREFYRKGHDGFYIEQNANKVAFSYLEDEFKKRGITSSVIVGMISHLKRATTVSTNAEIETNMTTFGVRLLDENNNQRTQKLEGPSEKVISLLTDILLRNPNIRNNCPIFAYIYNQDGTKKTYYEIKKIIMDNPSLNPLYRELIGNDPLLQIQKLEDELITSYFNSANNNSNRQEILNTYLTKIKEIVDKEKIDIQNLLVFFDKRLKELSDKKAYPNKMNEIRLLSLLAKQTILENQTIHYVEEKTQRYQKVFNSYSRYVEAKYHFFFKGKTRDQILSGLNTLLNSTNNNQDKSVIKTLISLVSYNGYNVITQSKEEINNSGLYKTNYYKQNESKELDFNLFAIANEIYMNCEQFIRTYDNGAYSIINDNPILLNLINNNPNIVELYNNILVSNPGKEIADRLNLTINICNEYLKKQAKK